jgi:hypothetical protein
MRPSRTNGPGVNATCISATARDPTNRLGCAALFPASASPVTISRLAAGMYSVAVPPPARGWSLDQHALHIEVAGSPARAGMVPLMLTWWPGLSRFPRPRGDGPLQAG